MRISLTQTAIRTAAAALLLVRSFVQPASADGIPPDLRAEYTYEKLTACIRALSPGDRSVHGLPFRNSSRQSAKIGNLHCSLTAYTSTDGHYGGTLEACQFATADKRNSPIISANSLKNVTITYAAEGSKGGSTYITVSLDKDDRILAAQKYDFKETYSIPTPNIPDYMIKMIHAARNACPAGDPAI